MHWTMLAQTMNPVHRLCGNNVSDLSDSTWIPAYGIRPAPDNL